jgi:glycogen debranching enzyme
MAGWNAETAAGSLGAGSMTLVAGTSFCISSANGDIYPEYPHGVFFRDTRILSRWILVINDQPLESLAAELTEPYRALFVARAQRAKAEAESYLVVERLREVGDGIVEKVTVHNYSSAIAACKISLIVEADFADLFEVKEARSPRRWNEVRLSDSGRLTIRATWEGVRKGIVASAQSGQAYYKGLTCNATIPPHDSWSTEFRVVPYDGVGTMGQIVGQPRGASSPSDERRRRWVERIPVLHIENPSIERTLGQSYEDLGALRIEDPSHPERVVVAAGAPWFMALFGRDSLWASIMSLPVDPSLALGTLQTLADRQGTRIDTSTEEEPGKILHEVRLDVSSGMSMGGKSTYYGSVDATFGSPHPLGVLPRDDTSSSPPRRPGVGLDP